ncbi:hypothetical protein QFC24_006335 [Naganishia onofrii]|uniref:Uncharacterized protein n=1 Tax=Naganishia onofrii TaxID=1851511 RepID=A0ACC2X2R9_9TREE|nr:hypothetical protein QFC24_006335 [Naganishia onofrii]
MRQLDIPEVTEATVIQGPKSPETFTFRYKSRSRGLVEFVSPYPGDEAAEELLCQNETSRAFQPITPNGVVKFDNNWVGCNEPCEDRHVENYLSRDILHATAPVKGSEKAGSILQDQPETSSLKLFSMIDGHGGCATADALARDLHPTVVKSLQSLYGGKKPSTVDPMLTMRLFQRGDYRSFLQAYFTMEGGHKNASTKIAAAFPITSESISNALASAYTGLDYDICTGPLRLISTKPAATTKKSDRNAKADVKSLVAPATNGACALTVLVDEDRQEVYVANTGDSRAVAGYYVPPHTASNGIHFQGGWRCEVLTEDHTAKGPKESERLRKEHPGEEDHLLCDNGRVLGDLMPARAFGEKSKGQLKFIILATDGPKYPGGREKGEELKGNWFYKDKNAATHLIRNAFEACKWHPEAGKEVISAKPPIARWMRDDVTCSVIFFGDASGEVLPKAMANKGSE